MVASDTRIFQTRFGPMLAFASDRYITGSLEAYGEYCPAEWELLAQLAKPGMTVVEVGANIGTHSVPLARACAPGLLYVFEPQQRVFQLLCANLAMNGVTNAIALPEACSDAEGVVVVPPIDYARASNVGGVEVSIEQGAGGQRARAAPLDALALAACGLIKIDAEGFEPKVVRGAAQTIARCRPLLYVENDRAAQQQELISLIAGLGYRLYWHLPPLFQPNNFKGATQNVFGPKSVVSINMLCVPSERGTVVQGLTQIDPDNWTLPIKLAR